MNQRSLQMADDGILLGNHLYLILRDYNIFVCIDTETSQLEIFTGIPKENILNPQKSGGINYWNDEVIMIPKGTCDIWFWNIRTKTWRRESLEKPLLDNIENAFMQSVVFDKKIFLIGAELPLIVCIDLTTSAITYITEPFHHFGNKRISDIYFRRSCVVVDEKLFLASCITNEVLILNLRSLAFEWVTVGEPSYCYSGIAYMDGNFWLSPRWNTPIIKWRYPQDNYEAFILKNKYKEDLTNFLGVVSFDSKIIMPGKDQRYTVLINDNETIKEIDSGGYSFYKKINEEICLAQKRNGNIEIIRPNGFIHTFNLREHKYQFLNAIKESEGGIHGLFEEIQTENEILGINELIECL